MLSDEQINTVTSELNKEVDLPIVGEKVEKAILKRIVSKISEVLDEELPPELKSPIHSLTEGVEFEGEQTLQQLTNNTVDFINKEVDVPLIDEQTEEEIYNIAIQMIFEALQKDHKL